MSQRNKDVIPFRQTPRFSPEDLDLCRLDDDDESRATYTESIQLPEVNMFGNLYTDSTAVIEVFVAENEEPDPAELLREYQEIHGIKLSTSELAKMLGWMDDLSQKALRQRIEIDKSVHRKITSQRTKNPGIMRIVHNSESYSRGEAI